MAQSTTATPPNSMQRLVELMARMNPYTAGQVDDMDLYISHPTSGASHGDPSQIEMELDGDYPGEWNFKGQSQKLNRVLRIKYRCKVRRKDAAGNQNTGDPVLYWMTAYLLVGFEDGGP
jgi:hypothetical protein